MNDSCISSVEGRERTIWLSVGLTRDEWDDAIEWLGEASTYVTVMNGGRRNDHGGRVLYDALGDAWLCADTDTCEGCEP